MSKTILLISLFTLLLSGCVSDTDINKDVDLKIPMQKQQPTPAATTIPSPSLSPSPTASVSAKKMSDTVTLSTSKGDITLKLYPTEAPLTVKNFLDKGASGYYKNLVFHRVESWVIQGGDPTGTGRGGGSIPTELSKRPFKAGSLGVARAGDIKVSNDSQFFICTTDCSHLTGLYTHFGEVISGMDVVKAIAIGDKILSIVEVQ